MAELMDWWAYYAYLNDRDEETSPPSDQAKIEMLNRMKEKWGA